jgi:DNA repair exonuclease SbcCD ATPase subunit
MKNFPYRLLFICIFAPAICYVFTLQAMEIYLQKQATADINQIIIKNQEALYQGRYTVKDELNRNLGEYFLDHSLRYKLGISTEIMVKTKDDRILYPASLKKDIYDSPGDSSGDVMNYMEVAAENYRILNNLITSIKITIKHNSWLSNSILLFYYLLSLFVIQFFIRKNIRETETHERERREYIGDLTEKLKTTESGLSEIRLKEDSYLKKIEELKRDRESLSTDIDGLLEEMESLEKGLTTQRDLREKRESELTDLQNEINDLKERMQNPKKKTKMTDAARKRFRVLYKNLEFSEKAIEGFLALSDEFQLKAEEVIHRLNEDRTLVSVKRKVFGKGGKMNVLEADFAYSGRVYYQADSQSKTRIMGIGTKNTQDQDIAYLEREIKLVAD